MNKKRVCIDVGGTFTDCLVMDETGLLQKFKSSTTPSDPSTGLMNALKKAAKHYKSDIREFLSQIEVLVHGTTLATNILIRRARHQGRHDHHQGLPRQHRDASRDQARRCVVI